MTIILLTSGLATAVFILGSRHGLAAAQMGVKDFCRYLLLIELMFIIFVGIPVWFLVEVFRRFF